MIYKDGFEMNQDLRFIKCPKCGNEQYSENALFCRICGLPAYNECEGATEYDEYGNNVGFTIHRNVGNARFCEYCGKPTMLFKEKILKTYVDAQAEQGIEDSSDFDDDELPFN